MYLVLFLSFILHPLYAVDTSAMIQDALNQFQQAIGQLNTDVKKVAVYSITTNKPQEIDTISVQDRIVNMLLESGKFKVIDRASLQALLKEQSLSLTGMVDNAQMVKAGKLIGVQGFFFGNMNLKNDRVVFTIKLIDVASSALVFSKTITGQAYNRVEIGVAGGFTSGTAMNTEYRYYNEWADVHELLPDKNKDIRNQAFSGIQLHFFYVQGFKNAKNIKMGLNLAYTEEDLSSNKVTVSIEGQSAGGSVYTGLSRFSIDPYLLIYPGIIGLNTRMFALTMGGSVNFITITSKLDSWGGSGEGGSTDGSLSAIKFFPEIGINFSPVKYIRIFVRGLYVLNDITFTKQVQLSGSGNFSMTQSNTIIQKGFIFNVGIGLSYTF